MVCPLETEVSKRLLTLEMQVRQWTKCIPQVQTLWLRTWILTYRNNNENNNFYDNDTPLVFGEGEHLQQTTQNNNLNLLGTPTPKANGHVEEVMNNGNGNTGNGRVIELEEEIAYVKEKAKEALDERDEMIETLKLKAREKFEEQDSEMESIKAKAKEVILEKESEIERLERLNIELNNKNEE